MTRGFPQHKRRQQQIVFMNGGRPGMGSCDYIQMAKGCRTYR